MKILKYFLSTILIVTAIWSCTDEDFGSLDFLSTANAPTNVAALFNVTQDNTGTVTITPNSEGAVSYDIFYGDNTESPGNVKQGKSIVHVYSEGTFTVKLVAIGITGLKTEMTHDLVVSFKAPENLEVVIKNDAAVSKKVNVTATADFAMSFDVYFGEEGNDEPVSANNGETASYVYAEAGTYTIRVVSKSAAIQTTEYTEEFVVTEILQPLAKAPTPPSRADVDVVSIFSEKYTPTKVDMFVTDWSVLTSQEEIAIEGNQTLVYRELSHAGIITESEPFDASAMEYFHFDIWSTNVATFKIKFVDFNGTGWNNGSDNIEFEIENTITEEGKWISFDIPLTDFVGVPFSDINQMVIAAAPVGTVFLDNMYFYKAPTVFADLPITFDSAVETFEPFLGAEFEITADPEDANNPVGKITNYGAENSWGYEGVSLKLDKWVDLSVIPTIKLDFYNDGATHDVSIKFEDSTSPLDGNNNPTVFEEVHVTVSNTGWSELVFNFTTGLSYDSIVLFVDGGETGISGTYYFDNVVNEEFISLPLTMDTPGQTFEPFLGAEFEITADPEDANNPVGKITNYGAENSWGYEGVSLKLDEWIDTNANATIKLDFYNDGVAHDVLIKLEDSTSPLNSDNNPTVFEEVYVTVSNTGWSELVFNFTSGLSYDNIALFVDAGVTGIPGTYYFDNVSQVAN
jgi:hypothetical protein